MRDIAARERLIVALDARPAEAIALARQLQQTVAWVKVGMTLFYEAGPEVVRELKAMDFRVFLDLKLHDIPHQVEGAARAAARLGIELLTVHAGGGEQMIAAAVRGATDGAEESGSALPDVIAVTVLTSSDDAVLRSVGVSGTAAEQAALLAKVARSAGAAGVVCSAHEAAAMRSLLGPEALVVTPGIRPSGADFGDQQRVATPGAALRLGASHLVLGRPITGAHDPSEAAKRVLDEMEGAGE